MLVVSRSPDAGDKSVIKVGDDIKIVIVAIRGNKVRVGIDAPADIFIARQELEINSPDEMELLPN